MARPAPPLPPLGPVAATGILTTALAALLVTPPGRGGLLGQGRLADRFVVRVAEPTRLRVEIVPAPPPDLPANRLPHAVRLRLEGPATIERTIPIRWEAHPHALAPPAPEIPVDRPGRYRVTVRPVGAQEGLPPAAATIRLRDPRTGLRVSAWGATAALLGLLGAAWLALSAVRELLAAVRTAARDDPSPPHRSLDHPTIPA